jgi:hypothetical protein
VEPIRWEGDGGSVLVAENGYLSAGTQRYAIAVHGHNGSGWVPESDEDRFGAMGVDLKPWRAEGGHVLVCGQRGIGSPLMASPPGWHHHTARALAKRTAHPIRIREHPGNKPPTRPLEDDLAGAHACVIWSSASGVKALTMGIPVLYAAPHWVASAAAERLAAIDSPVCDDDLRLKGLRRMAWSQWTVNEIDSGEPFVRIRDRIEEAKWPQP